MILSKRGIRGDEGSVNCVWCLEMVEEENHLFGMYGFAASIWCHIFK